MIIYEKLIQILTPLFILEFSFLKNRSHKHNPDRLILILLISYTKKLLCTSRFTLYEKKTILKSISLLLFVLLKKFHSIFIHLYKNSPASRKQTFQKHLLTEPPQTGPTLCYIESWRLTRIPETKCLKWKAWLIGIIGEAKLIC